MKSPKEIDGSPVIHEFIVMHDGWEMDNRGWVTADGRGWMTSHGGPPIPASSDEIHEHMAEALRSMGSMAEALKLMARKTKVEEIG